MSAEGYGGADGVRVASETTLAAAASDPMSPPTRYAFGRLVMLSGSF